MGRWSNPHNYRIPVLSPRIRHRNGVPNWLAAVYRPVAVLAHTGLSLAGESCLMSPCRLASWLCRFGVVVSLETFLVDLYRTKHPISDTHPIGTQNGRVPEIKEPHASANYHETPKKSILNKKLMIIK